MWLTCPFSAAAQGRPEARSGTHVKATPRLHPVLVPSSSDLLEGARRRRFGGTGGPPLTPVLPLK